MTGSFAPGARTARQRLLFAVLVALAVLAGPKPLLAADDAPPKRASLLPLVQPLWSELTAGQRTVLEPFAEQWNGWSATEKRSWVALADRVPRMSDEARERAARRVREWAELTPEQRRQARQNYRIAKRLSPEKRQAQWERYRELTPEQRSVLRTSGSTSNTAARHAGARTGLAKEAAQPLSDIVERNRKRPAERRRRIYY